MPARSYSPPIDAPGGTSGPSREGRGVDADGREQVLERLIGVRSSKPTFYAAWREKSARLDRTIETLERISAALCITAEGAAAVCQAVVEAAGHHFRARWAAMVFADKQTPPVIIDCATGVLCRSEDAPPVLEGLAAQAMSARALAVRAVTGGFTPTRSRGKPGAVAVPMLRRGELAGALAVGLSADAQVEESDVSILLTLANHAGLRRRVHAAR